MISKRGCHPSPNSTCTAHLAATTQTLSHFERLPRLKKKKKKTRSSSTKSLPSSRRQRGLSACTQVSNGPVLRQHEMEPTGRKSPLPTNVVTTAGCCGGCNSLVYISFSCRRGGDGGGGADTEGTGVVNLTVSHAEKFRITVWPLLSCRHFR